MCVCCRKYRPLGMDVFTCNETNVFLGCPRVTWDNLAEQRKGEKLPKAKTPPIITINTRVFLSIVCLGVGLLPLSRKPHGSQRGGAFFFFLFNLHELAQLLYHQ